MTSVYALAMARSASSPSRPSEASAKVRTVSSRHRSATARKSAFLFGKSRKRYGCETPTRRAIDSVDVP